MGSSDATRLDLSNPEKPKEGVRIHRYYNGDEDGKEAEEDICALPASTYEDEVKEIPDSALESSGFRGLL